MKSTNPIKFLASVILLLGVCSSAPARAAEISPFAGAWVGTVSALPLTLIISETGNVKGIVVEGWVGEIALRGKILSDGALSVAGSETITYRWPSTRGTLRDTFYVDIVGVVTIDETGHFVGVVEFNGSLVALDLAPQE